MRTTHGRPNTARSYFPATHSVTADVGFAKSLDIIFSGESRGVVRCIRYLTDSLLFDCHQTVTTDASHVVQERCVARNCRIARAKCIVKQGRVAPARDQSNAGVRRNRGGVSIRGHRTGIPDNSHAVSSELQFSTLVAVTVPTIPMRLPPSPQSRPGRRRIRTGQRPHPAAPLRPMSNR